MITHFNENSFHSTDSKGRLLLPKDIRSAFGIKKGDILVLVPVISDLAYLEIRTKAQWERYRTSLREDEASEHKKMAFRFADLAKDTAKVDGGGRFMIPQRMRTTCELNGDVAVVNMEDYIEVWAKKHLEKRFADMVQAFKETNDRMF